MLGENRCFERDTKIKQMNIILKDIGYQ